TNIAVFLQFHTTQIYDRKSKDAWDYATQFYASEEVCQQYMDLVMTPILDMLKEVEHRILFLSLGDELENEINDNDLGWNTDNTRVVYGVSFDDMYRFYSELNDLCKEKMPDIPRTIGANASYLHKYGELDLQAMGRNRYSSFGTDMEAMDFWEYKTGLPMYFPEWGIGCWYTDMSWQEYQDRNIVMLDNIRDYGYFGAFFWRYEHTQKDDSELTMYNSLWEFPADYNTLATRFAYEARKDLHEYQGTDGSFDPPTMFAYNGDGLVTWLHAEKGKTFDLERSLDGGKTWTKLLTGVKNSAYRSRRNANIGYYQDDEVEEDQAVLYRVTAYNEAGESRVSDVSIQVPDMDNTIEGGGAPAGVDEKPLAEDPAKNILINGGFEDAMNGWTSRAYGTCAWVEGGHESDHAMKIMDATNRWGGFQQYFRVEPGKTYRISFSYKDLNQKGDSAAYIRLSHTNDNYTEDAVSIWFSSEDTAWHTKEATFTSDGYSYARLAFQPDTGKGSEKLIDNVHIEMIGDDDNLIRNGYFNNELKDWVVATNGDGICELDPTGDVNGGPMLKMTGTEGYTVELSTLNLKVDPHCDYVLNFDLKCVVNGQMIAVYVKGGNELNCDTIFRDFWPGTSAGMWENKTFRFNSGEYEYLRLNISNPYGNEVYHLDNITLFKEVEKPVRYQVIDYTTTLLLVRDQADNLITDANFEEGTGNWNVETFVDGTTLRVVEDAEGARNGDTFLRYEGKGLTETHQAVFYVDVEPNTNYSFGAWIKGPNLSADNNGDVFIGIVDPESHYYLIGDPLEYGAGAQLDFSSTRGIKPSSFDGDWHLRGFTFNTLDMTRVGIMISGTNAQMDIDDIMLCRVEHATAYTSPLNKTDMKTTLYFGDKGCAVKDNLFENYNFESEDMSFWSTTHGYGNYVWVDEEPTGTYGTALRYVGDDPKGLLLAKWLHLKPNTDYIFSCSMYVTKSGNGYVGLMDDKMRLPAEFFAMDFDLDLVEMLDDDGDGWVTLSCAFNSAIFERVALIIYDGGGEAYIDNLRLFEADKATEIVNDNRPFDEPLNGWIKEEGKWAYYENDVKVTNKWVKDSAGWCYLGADGYAVTNCWKKDSHGWCYLNASGSMVKNAWVKDNGKWYFLDANGYMVT
ncbi:MAG: carbohydrate binding domain-containing protein, partial [Clostridia bacterium]|nr:carbohydrate binding domain-containing protein [Clostridia bacterium]